METFSLKNLFRIASNVGAFLLINWHIVALAIAVAVLALFVSSSVRSCKWREVNKLGNEANRSANSALIKTGERNQIRLEAERDLEDLKNERQIEHEKLSNSSDNLNRFDFNVNGSGADLDRKADDFRRRHSGNRND